MNKLKSNPFVSLLVLVMACCGFSANAADANTPPQVTMFYPASDPSNPQTLFDGNAAYVYFENGSQIVSVSGRVVQDDVQKGTCMYLGSAKPNNVVKMNTGDKSQFDVQGLTPGLFAIELLEVKYLVNDVEYTYSADAANPISGVIYRHVAANGTVVEMTGIADGVFKSYYEEDDLDGVVTVTFSKPIADNASVNVFLEYGELDQYIIHHQPFKFSDDRKTITIDFRGVSRTVDDLAPGVTFVNEFGVPIPPPVDISLNINGLTCDDGTVIEFTAYSNDGAHSTLLKGSVYKSYDYVDLGFATPVLTGVEFYSKANPTQRFNSINESTDMMDLKISHAEYIAKADMVIEVGEVSVVIPDADIVKSEVAYTVQLPAAIRTAGSEGMVVKLENVEFTESDGSEHVIKPFHTSDSMMEVLTVADLKKLDANTKVVLNVPEGIVITLSNDQGYTFAQDATAGIMLTTPDYSKVFGFSSLVKGRIVGTYMGYGTFMVDKGASDYSESIVDVSLGAMVSALDDLSDGAFDSQLITVTDSEATPITIDSAGNILIAGVVPVITDFVDGYEMPEKVVNITGVYYNDPSISQPCLLVRNMLDFNQNLSQGANEVEDIASLKALGLGEEATLRLTDAKVTYANDMMGVCFVEDATGAIMVYMDDDESLLAPQGVALNGAVTGYLLDQAIFVVSDAEVALEDADVTYGAEIAPEEASDAANLYRLVTFNAAQHGPFVVEPFGISIGDKVMAVDYFGVLDYDYTFPAEVRSFTGIIVPGMSVLDDFDQPSAAPALVALRSADDVFEILENLLDYVISSSSSLASDVYDLRGVKVRAAGESLSGLRGIYIVDGHKSLIK